MECQCWNVNFKTEICSKTADPHLTMQWIKGSWDSKVNWRTFDIAIDCGTNWLPRLRYAVCDDCVCIDKAFRQACTLPTKSKCRRAMRSKVQPIFTREANRLFDLRAFSRNQSLWSSTRSIRFVQYTHMTMSKIWTYDVTKHHCQQVNHLQKWSRKGYTWQNWRILFSFRLYWLGTRNCTKHLATKLFEYEGSCKNSYWSNDGNSKSQSPGRERWERNGNQESKKKESLCWKESGRMLSDNVPEEETMHQERCGRRAAWDMAKNIYKLKHSDKITF